MLTTATTKATAKENALMPIPEAISKTTEEVAVEATPKQIVETTSITIMM
jgi:hypothetical protein